MNHASDSTAECRALCSVWIGDSASLAKWSPPSWPEQGIAITGDFSGIQSFVLKPVPGAKGAAKRLRGRSFQVIDITRQIANDVTREFSASLFYSAGGRFLVFVEGAQISDWRDRVLAIQRRWDRALLERFDGEVAFHLAAAPFRDYRIPADALYEALLFAKSRPLSGVLNNQSGWLLESFVKHAGPGWSRCPACLRTQDKMQESEDETICNSCAEDKRLGWQISRGVQAGTQPSNEVVHWTPRNSHGEPLSFDEIAERACGWRKWLGYLRVDADHIGAEFSKLHGDPLRSWALSNLLQTFFCERVQHIIASKYPFLYPVYGGGDDLFLIGPWDQTLRFAAHLSGDFQRITSGRLKLSAGFALSKPHEHILTKSDEASNALAAAKRSGRNRISAMGVNISWDAFTDLLETSRRVSSWYDNREIPSSLLQHMVQMSSVAELARVRGSPLSDARHQPLLHYQIERTLSDKSASAKAWAKSVLHDDAQWKSIGFVVRYAILSRKREEEGEVQHARQT